MSSEPSKTSTYDPSWIVRGDGVACEEFTRLVRRAVVGLGQKFVGPAEAVDYWLNEVHAYLTSRDSWQVRDPWCIRNLLFASAEYCAELATRFHEAGKPKDEKKFVDLERQLRDRPDPSGYSVIANDPRDALYAIRRGDIDPQSDAMGDSRNGVEGRQRATEGPVKGTPGPKPNPKIASLIAEIVSSIAPNGNWKSKLDEICEALDDAKIPCPKTWAKRDPPIRNWTDAATTASEPAKKAIEYQLKIAPK